MGLRDIFKRTSSMEASGFPETIGACARGNVIPISEVKDEAFASEAMGKGLAVIPEAGEICAPTDGNVEMVFPTRHAIGLKTKNGTEILIHIGINTVELNGKGFECLVKQGDKVKAGQLIERFDLEALKKDGYDPTVMQLITNTDDYDKVTLENDALILEK